MTSVRYAVACNHHCEWRASMLDSSVWPTNDYSRVPYRFYHDPSIYELERERVFKGPSWTLIGLEVEIPNPGDFRASYIGDEPIIIHRDEHGKIHGFVNRCAHRGAIVRRELQGNAKDHVCIYHQWCYGQDGGLVGVPFRRGLKGKGGYGKDFDTKNHGLRKVRIDSIDGVLFGTLSDKAEPLNEYLGEAMLGFMSRVFRRPVEVLGYHRQRIRGNWKGFAENTRDNYHASLLHDFFRTFGLDRPTQVGGATMDKRHRHCVTWGRMESGNDAAKEAYGKEQVASAGIQLQENSMVKYIPDRNDDISIAIGSLFPSSFFIQISNSLATRQIRPRGPGEFEVFQTLLGYQDDTPEMRQHRLRQANLVGPAGFVSMEDGEAIEIVQRATKPAPNDAQVLELGGKGAIQDCDFRINDVPVRGFWSYYAELLGIEPPDGVR
ncbi:MAG TPA: Rieske 2Fe-2S domain-containing protein [Xanthobacteraceae bacterium]|nr:Rieske 2Fe-2S domain-containing protein [Xanthobacteraceae bacterium]